MRNNDRWAVAVVAVAGAGLGAASFGWGHRLHGILPALAFGVVALFVLPITVPALIQRRGAFPNAHSILAPTIGAFVAYFAALLLSYFAVLTGSG